MVSVMSSIYAMVDGNVSGAIRGGTEEKAQKHAEKLFKMIDIDGDGNLTENEFLRVNNINSCQKEYVRKCIFLAIFVKLILPN